MPLTALADEIVTTTAFREDLATHLKHAREGHVVTVIVTNGDVEPVAVISRRLLAEQVQTVHDLVEDLEAALDTIAMLSNPDSIETLNAAAAEVARGGGLTVEEVRKRLGWAIKEGV